MTDPWDWYIYLHENHKNQRVMSLEIQGLPQIHWFPVRIEGFQSHEYKGTLEILGLFHPFHQTFQVPKMEVLTIPKIGL